MLDYHADCVALSEFVSVLGAASFPDAEVTAARQDALAAVADEPGPALLGAFVQHLLVHAASDGAELAMLEKAAGLWGRGRALCDRLGTARADLEHAMEDPGAAGAAERFNAAAVRAQEVANDVARMRAEVDELREEALTFRHLPPHPRQQDLDTAEWEWGGTCTRPAGRTRSSGRCSRRPATPAGWDSRSAPPPRTARTSRGRRISRTPSAGRGARIVHGRAGGAVVPAPGGGRPGERLPPLSGFADRGPGAGPVAVSAGRTARCLPRSGVPAPRGHGHARPVGADRRGTARQPEPRSRRRPRLRPSVLGGGRIRP